MSEDTERNVLKQSINNFYEILINSLNDAVYLIDENINILLANPASKKLFGYSQVELSGNPCQKNILIPAEDQHLIPCNKDCPIQKALHSGNLEYSKAYARHKEGYLIPVMLKAIPIKVPNSKIIGAAVIFSEISPKVSLPQSPTNLDQMQLLDPFTKLGNNQYIKMFINSRLDDQKKYSLPFGVLFLEIDNINKIVDNYGSVVGDKMIKMISQTLANNIRFYEMLGRWDYHKFAITLFNVNLTKLDLIANKLRLLVEQSHIRHHDKLLNTTVSIIGTLAHPTDSSQTIIDRLKNIEVKINKSGKNRVTIET